MIGRKLQGQEGTGQGIRGAEQPPRENDLGSGRLSAGHAGCDNTNTNDTDTNTDRVFFGAFGRSGGFRSDHRLEGYSLGRALGGLGASLHGEF
jgi:hypothetical protein